MENKYKIGDSFIIEGEKYTVFATKDENKGMLFPKGMDYLIVTDDNKERRFVLEKELDQL
jgi:hypothetical protein